jgi:hypothetical protein
LKFAKPLVDTVDRNQLGFLVALSTTAPKRGVDANGFSTLYGCAPVRLAGSAVSLRASGDAEKPVFAAKFRERIQSGGTAAASTEYA